jgi:nitrous oxide reductase accessory protein NosL
MRHSWRILIALVAVIILFGLLTACGEAGQQTPGPRPTPLPTDEPAGLDGQTILEERCVDCHTLSRVRGAQYDESQWQTSVRRMVSYGAQLSEEEREVLIAYLTENYGP